MSINPTNPVDQLYRVNPVDKDRSEDDSGDPKKRRKVTYRGRSWAEEDDHLPLSPVMHNQQDFNLQRAHRPIYYADSKHLEAAHEMLFHLTTLEERLAQLFFFPTTANYLGTTQATAEEAIQEGQVGGVLFSGGEHKREAYLIEHFQNLSKTKLLIANDFSHGLSFYFQENDQIPDKIDTKRASDLGKAAMVQSRCFGVHVLFDTTVITKGPLTLSAEQAKAFRKGIRQAQGIVGRRRGRERAKVCETAKPALIPPMGKAQLLPIMLDDNIKEAVGLKTIDFEDLREASNFKEALHKAVLEGHDAFIIDGRYKDAIATMAELVRSGQIKESVLEKKVLKILLIKTLC